MDVIEKINAALFGIDEDTDFYNTYELRTLKTGITRPPSYLVALLLSKIRKYSVHKNHEKSLWQFFLKYHEIKYHLRDWKGNSWNIETPNKTPEVNIYANELHKKISAASQILDKYIRSVVKEKGLQDGFYIENTYWRCRPIYEFFKEKVKSTIKNKERYTLKVREGKIEINSFSEFGNKVARYEKAISYNACAMIVFYFSYIELIMDVNFCFIERRDMAYKKFKSVKFTDRFCLVFPITTNKGIEEIYQSIKKIQKRFRNVILHGFADFDAAISIPIRGFGLIPISYEDYSDSVHSTLMPVEAAEALSVIDVFKRLDKWMVNNKKTFYAYEYARSGMEIPFEKERVDEIRGWMTSKTIFRQNIREELEKLDYIANNYFG